MPTGLIVGQTHGVIELTVLAEAVNRVTYRGLEAVATKAPAKADAAG